MGLRTTTVPCERCEAVEGVELEGSRTRYEAPRITRYQRLSGNFPRDPNVPVALCRACAHDHHAYWDEMWEDYYRSQG